VQEKPYYSLMEQVCRAQGWVLGQDKGDMVLGVPHEGEQQSLAVYEFQDSSGQFALRLWSPICAADKLPADQALKINYQLPHGALAVHDGAVGMVATRVLNHTNQTDLTTLVTALTYYAAFYKQHYGA